MKHFINLTSRVINTFHIIEIIKHPNMYLIHMSNNSISGFMLLSSGNLNSDPNIITICSTKNKQDYKLITDFLYAAEEVFS
jgi:hypothetical protein